jgi:hypothetical protein
MEGQLSFFDARPKLPEGFKYEAEVVTPEAESLLLSEIRNLPFRDFEFHDFTGKRRVVSFRRPLRPCRSLRLCVNHHAVPPFCIEQAGAPRCQTAPSPRLGYLERPLPSLDGSSPPADDR